MKLILLTTLASLALADPHYGYGYGLYGPGIAGHPGYATSYTHRSPQGIGKRSADPEPHLYGQYGWPSVSGPHFTSTCWGCRGKRSAEVDNVNRVSGASPFPSYTAAWPGATVSVNHMGKRSADAHGMINNVNRVSGLSPFPSYHSAWPGATVMVNHFGKRSADAEPEADAHMGMPIIDNVNYVSGLSPFPSYTAAWPGAHVMVNHFGKRSADAEPEADAHFMGGVAGHPYGGTSYVGRTVWGFPSMHAGHHYGKRSADADPHYGYGYGLYGHGLYGHGIAAHPGYATSYTHRSPQGIGKRSADAHMMAMPMTGIAGHPGGATSYVGRTVWGFPLAK